MAIYNEILAARFNRLLQKFLSMKGPASMNQLAPELVPSIVMFFGVEGRFLEGWNRFAISVFIAAGAAGKNSQLRIRNGSTNVIAVIEKAMMWTSGTSEYALQLGQPGTDLGTSQNVNTRPLDGRLTQAGPSATPIQPQMIVSSDNTITGAGQIGADIWDVTQIANTPTDAIWYENQEIGLTPGWTMAAVLKASAQAFAVNLMWRERVLEDSELK